MARQNDGPPIVGIDLGGTKILVGIVDAENRVLGRAKRSTPAKEGGEAILETMLEAVDEALAGAGVSRSDLGGVGIGSPGPLDTKTGVILFSANLNVRNFPLGPGVAQALGKPAVVSNDVRVGGYGEFRLGAGRGYRNLIITFVGTGIGGCLISNGELLLGHTGNAGEIGHIVIKAGGPRCGCGARGCMESLASKTAITRRAYKAIRRGVPSVLGTRLTGRNSRLKSRDLAAAVQAKDPVAIKEVNRAAHYLGLGLGSLINVFGPEAVIIGGGVTNALDSTWIDLIRSSARKQILADPEGQIQIRAAALGDDAGILGAALLARESFVPESLPIG